MNFAIRIPFQIIGGRVQAANTYEEVVRGQVIDALMTNRGERVFRPMYGCDIQAALFDPRDELVRRDASRLISNRLESLVPRCTVTSVSIETPSEGPLVYVTIVYRPSPLSSEVSLTVPVSSSSEFFTRATELQQNKGLNE